MDKFKEDAVQYRNDDPELTLHKTSENIGISESVLKNWLFHVLVAMHGKHILLLRTKFIEVYSKKKFWIFEKLKEEGKTVANCYVHDSGIIQNREVVEMIVSSGCSGI